MTRGWHWSARVALGSGLIASAWWAVHQPRLQPIDVRLGDAVRYRGSPHVDRAVVLTTDLGSLYAVTGIAAVLAASGRTRLAGDVAGVGIVAWNVAQRSKTRVRRLRPYEAEGARRLIRRPTGSSFPSGHAAVGMAIMATAAEQARGPRGRALLHALGAYVAVSRVYVGVHYPTDVAGGAGLGLVVAGLWRGPAARAGRALLRRAACATGALVRRCGPVLRPLGC